MIEITTDIAETHIKKREYMNNHLPKNWTTQMKWISLQKLSAPKQNQGETDNLN